ncbi:MAG: glycosyl hydrolase 115 family protein [Bacteroidaceae bacterium]|nr:glycosyl hydrolase 115 family protein [Bacteroidaceae bacterium]
MKRITSIFFTISLFLGIPVHAKSTFSIADARQMASVQVDDNDWKAVHRAAQQLQEDIVRVVGKHLPTSSSNHILVGTLGHSQLIDSLASAGIFNADAIRGQWESFLIQPTNNGQLIVAGSDRRGTIYGIYEISKRIGVSPWYWWADVPVPQRSKILWTDGQILQKSPAVKYRGIFINDEDWGLKPWASNNYEKELGDIGPRTYERVFELVLRLGGNMVAPAMHSCTGAFYSHPESKVVADEMGVIITTSHCEPMLFNNAALSEWDTHRDGEWNYRTNRGTILGKFANRVAEAYEFENIYTVAMRGVHDEGMRGQTSPQERVAVLTDVISDQRKLLQLFTGKQAEEVPQIFVPYKETLDVYQAGLQVPEDVTLVWPDDNYGYMKRLSNPAEQRRSGGSGVYYHLSYLGTPHDYLWVCSTPPVLMYEELKKAYDTGCNRYWLLNVGDIKPMELGVQTFFDFARDPQAFDYRSINEHQAKMLANIFGEKYRKDFQYVLDEYYRLAWSRKPEYMGWDWQWDEPERCRLRDSEFSFQNYQEAQQRLADYESIARRVQGIMQKLDPQAQPAFFELIGFMVLGAEQMNRKFLFAQLNHEQHAAGHYAEANWAANESRAAFNRIEELCHIYNTQLDGKWNGMMTVPPGFVSLYQNMPDLNFTEGIEPKAVNLAVSSSKQKAEGCCVIDLTHPTHLTNATVIHGIGYDWDALQLGDAIASTTASADYTTGAIPADVLTLHVYCLPFFPIYEGKSNCFSISVDGQAPIVLENQFTEWSFPWKEQVLKNGKEFTLRVPIDKSRKQHTLQLKSIDTGQMVERIVLDWGGLKKSYLGPQK